MSLTVTVGPARPEELEPAFRLFFCDLEARERDRRVAAALSQVRSGELDPAGILLAQANGALCGVLVCQLTPGASALIWPPHVADAAGSAAEDELVRQACRWLRQKGAKLAHALLTDEDMTRAQGLTRNGFRHVTRLAYLRHDLKSLPRLPRKLRYQTCDLCDMSVFQSILARTYEGTLDCPEVNHVRTPEEILAGHRASGRHDPRRWWLAWDGDRPAGVLLLTDVPALDGWDLSYLGVVPEARRRGVGRELACKALWEARLARAPQLTLTVDERNEPARALYRELGFEPYDRREVFLAIWEAAPQDASQKRR